MSKTLELKVDELRQLRSDLGDTGIYVRAMDADGKIGTHDIILLDKESLLKFLRSSGGKNTMAENVVSILLCHGHIVEEGEVP